MDIYVPKSFFIFENRQCNNHQKNIDLKAFISSNDFSTVRSVKKQWLFIYDMII